MSALPLTIGTIHFVGIGGIGMSGIAEISGSEEPGAALAIPPLTAHWHAQ